MGGMSFGYDPGIGVLSSACSFNNTVVPHVLARYEFWLFLFLHLLVYVVYNLGYMATAADEHGVAFMDWNDVKVITAITTFFEVFYSNQCYSRYIHLYKESRDIFAALHDLSFQLCLHLGRDAPKHMWLATRYALLSVFLFFEDQYRENDDASWEDLIARGFATHSEKHFLDRLAKEQRYTVLMFWSSDVARIGLKEAKCPSNTLKSVAKSLETLRSKQQEVADTISLPIPFQYFHMLNVMVCMNVLSWAYIMGVTPSLFGPFVFFCAALIFIGMMELGSQLSNPFGQDEVDFPVAAWLNEYASLVGFLLTSHSRPADKEWRNSLKSAKFDWRADDNGYSDDEEEQRLGGNGQQWRRGLQRFSPGSARRIL